MNLAAERRTRERVERERLAEDLHTIGIGRELNPEFFNEIHYALQPPVHERHTPTFGAMTDQPYTGPVGRELPGYIQMELPFPLPPMLQELWHPDTRHTGRTSCDGYRTFLLTRGDGTVATVGLNAPADELSLGLLQGTYGYSSVQRTGEGKVKVLLPELIAMHDKNAWTVKPYSRVMSWPLRRLQMPPAAQRLLDLAVHVLSPSNVGTTLVMGHPDELHGPALGPKRIEIEPLATHPATFAAIRSIASQNDRAMAFDLEGRLVAYDIELTFTDEYRDLPVDGGTRHSSAARASATQPEILVIVVSSDGPVSVFLQGQRIANFEHGAWLDPCQTCEGGGEMPDPFAMDENAPPISCARCAGTGKLWERGPIFRYPTRDHLRLRANEVTQLTIS